MRTPMYVLLYILEEVLDKIYLSTLLNKKKTRFISVSDETALSIIQGYTQYRNSEGKNC